MSATQKYLDLLEARMGYEFHNRDLLVTALTHSSYGDGRRKFENNEKLEFLGDRVLGLFTAEMLFLRGSVSEGRMARQLNALVRKETCADVAREVDIPAALRMSASEEKQGGRDKTSILGDACEAVLGAIYLDGGAAAARNFYARFWGTRIDKVVGQTVKDPKTELQERASATGHQPPMYKLIERTGPDHQPSFIIEVKVLGVGTGIGTGSSKKLAERQAASNLLAEWSKEATT